MKELIVKDIPWPPVFKLKRHIRAKSVKLKTSIHNGLEIVIPIQFSLKHLPKILEDNKAWILKKLFEVHSLLPLNQKLVLPEKVELQAVNQIWKIHYVKSKLKRVRLIVRPDNEIILWGNVDNQKLCFKALTCWVKQQAEIILIPYLKNLSDNLNLPYKTCVVRGQKSRWGSCTSNHDISLNFKLIFLPKKLMEHILIHELCHTIQMNHSSLFWKLVAEFDPQWKAHNKLLQSGDRYIPNWIIN